MCSNDDQAGLAARLGSVIDDLAAAASEAPEPAGSDLAARLAAVWALVTEADPELAERTARYAGRPPTAG